MADPNDLSPLPQADQDAIGATLLSLLSGFRERDADKLVGIYTSDADWVNAFGSVKKGGDDIVEYLRGLFSDDNFNAGTVKAPPETSMKVLTPEVGLVSAHLQVEGQKLVGGGEIEVRDNLKGPRTRRRCLTSVHERARVWTIGRGQPAGAPMRPGSWTGPR